MADVDVEKLRDDVLAVCTGIYGLAGVIKDADALEQILKVHQKAHAIFDTLKSPAPQPAPGPYRVRDPEDGPVEIRDADGNMLAFVYADPACGRPDAKPTAKLLARSFKLDKEAKAARELLEQMRAQAEPELTDCETHVLGAYWCGRIDFHLAEHGTC